MTNRIEIISTIEDSRAEVRKKKLSHIPDAKNISSLFVADVYTIDKSFSKSEIGKIAEALYSPVNQKVVTRSKSLHGQKKKNGYTNGFKFSYAIEVGFLPGVTDNVSHTVKESVEDLLKKPFQNGENVYTSQITFLDGDISEKEVTTIASELYNPLIQRAAIKTWEKYTKDGGMDIVVPKVVLQSSGDVVSVELEGLSDEQLTLLGKLGIFYPNGLSRGPLALDVVFLKTIREYFRKKGRAPTDIELESIAQTWSEHCKHTIFSDPIDDVKDGLYKTYIKNATEEINKQKNKSNEELCVSVFTDNSGAIAFDQDYLVTHKVETHNSPSALDPFGGSITGIVGVNRDTIGFGMGAKPIANFYGFCFASPNENIRLFRDKNLQQEMLSSKRIMEGVIEGVNAGGNQSGIPTPQGFVYFDQRYRGKPLVFVGTVGLIPRKIKDKNSWIKKANAGDYIVMVGGRVGKDGIHGATFSSEALDSGSPATAVQIGDPITQKKLSDALIKEAREQLLYTSITDNGAGGLSCSVAEMAKESGGALVQLEKIPLKYPGLAPWEIWISESQERMTVAVPQQNWKKFSDLMKQRGVEATIIGEFTNSGSCIVTLQDKIIMDIDMDFLHDGLPKRPMTTKQSIRKLPTTHLKRSQSEDYTEILQEMLSRQNIGSFEFISGQYDHIVQSNLVLGPIQGRGRVNGETSVIRPVLTAQKGVVLSQGLYPTYSDSNCYNMAACSIDTAIRNVVAAGASIEKIALLDNFCWCSATDPERLYQLKTAAQACFDTAVAYKTPFISGKDSMFNDFKGFDSNGKPITISIPPTLLVSSIGIIDDISKAVSLDSKFAGDLVYVLGTTTDELGGSEYFGLLREQQKKDYVGSIPKVDTMTNKKLYTALLQAMNSRVIASSISIGRGGLGVALCKTAMGGYLGLDISLKNVGETSLVDDSILFSESQGRILVTIAPTNKKIFETFMKGNNLACIGVVTDDKKFIVRSKKDKKIIDTDIDTLISSYRKPFSNFV